jgi:hypothetical protein
LGAGFGFSGGSIEIGWGFAEAIDGCRVSVLATASEAGSGELPGDSVTGTPKVSRREFQRSAFPGSGIKVESYLGYSRAAPSEILA